jgi:hypothetical protein
VGGRGGPYDRTLATAPRVAGASAAMESPVPNPYAAPRAAVVPPQGRTGRRLGWKIYFWGSGFLVAAACLWIGFSEPQPLDLVDLLLFTPTAYCGLFGYAYRRRIGQAAFWRTWFWVDLLWTCLLILALQPLGLVYVSDSEPVFGSELDFVFEIPFLVPLFVALYRYGFRSPELWKTP